MNKFLETIHDMIEIITGERPKQETERAKGFTKDDFAIYRINWIDKAKNMEMFRTIPKNIEIAEK